MFKLWTDDEQHVMKGFYSNGYFVGRDNHGKRAIGVYENGLFAGVYDVGKDREIFYGSYGNGRWEAHGLFHLENSEGSYELFPGIAPLAVAKQSSE